MDSNPSFEIYSEQKMIVNRKSNSALCQVLLTLSYRLALFSESLHRRFNRIEHIICTTRQSSLIIFFLTKNIVTVVVTISARIDQLISNRYLFMFLV